jgi:hypothetical protein
MAYNQPPREVNLLELMVAVGISAVVCSVLFGVDFTSPSSKIPEAQPQPGMRFMK